MKKLFTTTAFGLFTLLSPAVNAITLTFDEDGIEHGTIINDQYSDLGITIRANNRRANTADLAVAYDTTPRPRHWLSNRDRDLNTHAGIGNALIIQENNFCSSTLCYAPDDEGSRPSGSLFIDFDKAITALSFDILDIEIHEVNNQPVSSSVIFYDDNGNNVKSVRFEDIDGAMFGNYVYAQLGTIGLSGLGVTTVEFALGGSGAIDNISVSQVPIPASLGIFALGLLGLQIVRRKLVRH